MRRSSATRGKQSRRSLPPSCYRSYARRWLKDSGQHNDEKMSHEAVQSLSYATFFRHLAVLSLKALLSHNVSNIHSLTSGKYFKSRLQQWNNITPFECNSSKVIRYFTINGTNSLFCFVFAFLCLCFVLFFYLFCFNCSRTDITGRLQS